jgi:hypothetical protein
MPPGPAPACASTETSRLHQDSTHPCSSTPDRHYSPLPTGHLHHRTTSPLPPSSAATASSPARWVISHNPTPRIPGRNLAGHAGILPESTSPRPLRHRSPGGYFPPPEPPSRAYKGPCTASRSTPHRTTEPPCFLEPPNTATPTTIAGRRPTPRSRLHGPSPDQGEGRDR